MAKFHLKNRAEIMMQQGTPIPTTANRDLSNGSNKVDLLKKLEDCQHKINCRDSKKGEALELPATPHNTSQYLMDDRAEREEEFQEEWGSMLFAYSAK